MKTSTNFRKKVRPIASLRSFRASGKTLCTGLAVSYNLPPVTYFNCNHQDECTFSCHAFLLLWQRIRTASSRHFECCNVPTSIFTPVFENKFGKLMQSWPKFRIGISQSETIDFTVNFKFKLLHTKQLPTSSPRGIISPQRLACLGTLSNPGSVSNFFICVFPSIIGPNILLKRNSDQ